MQMAERLDLAEEHNCELLKDHKSIGIQQFNDGKWYFARYGKRNVLHEILYCPYCGEQLK